MRAPVLRGLAHWRVVVGSCGVSRNGNRPADPSIRPKSSYDVSRSHCIRALRIVRHDRSPIRESAAIRLPGPVSCLVAMTAMQRSCLCATAQVERWSHRLERSRSPRSVIRAHGMARRRATAPVLHQGNLIGGDRAIVGRKRPRDLVTELGSGTTHRFDDRSGVRARDLLREARAAHRERGCVVALN